MNRSLVKMHIDLNIIISIAKHTAIEELLPRIRRVGGK